MRSVRGPWGRGDWLRGGGEAMETARERFARGEISLEELEAIRRGLES